MKLLVVLLFLVSIVYGNEEIKIEKTYHGLTPVPQSIYLNVIPSKVIKSSEELSNFVKTIIQPDNTTRSQKPNLLLEKTDFDFSSYMILVAYHNNFDIPPKFTEIKVDENKMFVNVSYSPTFGKQVYAKYTAVLLPKFEGEIVFNRSLKKRNIKVFGKYDCHFVVLQPSTYFEQLPENGNRPTSIEVAKDETFDIVDNIGNYWKVRFYSGDIGYVESSGPWKKLMTGYGKLESQPRDNIISSFSQGNRYIISETSKEEIPTYFFSKTLRFSSQISSREIKQYEGKRVKIRGVNSFVQGFGINIQSVPITQVYSIVRNK